MPLKGVDELDGVKLYQCSDPAVPLKMAERLAKRYPEDVFLSIRDMLIPVVEYVFARRIKDVAIS